MKNLEETVESREELQLEKKMDPVDVDALLKKARAGKAGGATVHDCVALRQNFEPQHGSFPDYCTKLLNSATKTGILHRRDSRVARAWDISDGHGVNRLRPTERVQGGSVDVANPANSTSTADIYASSKDPEAQEKIRRLHVRAASRGARPRVEYDAFTGNPDNQRAMNSETRKELVRRASRRDELRNAGK